MSRVSQTSRIFFCHAKHLTALSTHERRQLALAKQIAELEQEAIGPKDWTLLGEASSRARPENSLLEEHLDFEQIGKVVPVVTEETVKSLEDIIKARIIDVSTVQSPPSQMLISAEQLQFHCTCASV